MASEKKGPKRVEKGKSGTWRQFEEAIQLLGEKNEEIRGLKRELSVAKRETEAEKSETLYWKKKFKVVCREPLFTRAELWILYNSSFIFPRVIRDLKSSLKIYFYLTADGLYRISILKRGRARGARR